MKRKKRFNPMEPWARGLKALASAPTCGAKTRRGTACKAPAMANGRCRIHGGLSPGAPRGVRNGNWRHGRHTKAAREENRFIRELIRTGRRTLAEKV